MTRLICAATVTAVASLLMAASAIGYRVFARMNPSRRIMNAGPAVNADARNRGPSSGEFHRGLEGGAANRNAVMRWMLTAHMTER